MEEGSWQRAVRLASEKFPRNHDKFIQYGTAGFRTKADDLPHVMFRMGLLAALRSKVKKATIGVMITASHNPEQDNGVKLIDPLGEMLEMSWEKHATQLANVTDGRLVETLGSLLDLEKIDMSCSSSVAFARDTRPSSEALSQAVNAGLVALGCTAVDYGLLTTPQLHYMVRCRNSAEAYGKPTEEGYYSKLSAAFIQLQILVKDTRGYSSELVLDAANGVGACKAALMQKYLGETLTLKISNDGTTGKLNYKCGADYVKVNQCAPEGVTMLPGMKCTSFDGDADRIVFYYVGEDNKFHLLDGDRIATLVAGYIQNLLQTSGLDLSLGLVQTAYANGSSTNYINGSLQVPVACVATGVKHLHHKAQDFDIGVYFEANGHGTVLFSSKAEDTITKATTDASLTDSQKQAVSALRTTVDLINQTVGDALSDLMLVEVVLCSQGWTLADWQACYTDLPNRQSKVKVKDRTVIQTTDAERKTTSPEGLQEGIDKLVKNYTNGRSFVRPSGTEDIVRVYAEADTQVNADMLAYEVSCLVYDMAGGVDGKPVPPQSS